MKIGQSQLRFEDDALIRGRGRYTADASVPGEVAAVLLRSPVSAGEIVSLDISEASTLPGVLAVLTGRDMVADGIGSFQPRIRFPGPDGGDMRVPVFRPMTSGPVRYLGEPVAVVIAETRSQADDAAERIAVEFSSRPVVVDCLQALDSAAPLVWDDYPDNRSFVFQQGDEAATDAAIAAAPRVIRKRLRISRVTAAALEPRGALAIFEPAPGRYRLEIGTQSPHRLAAELGAVLGAEPSRLRVIARDTGGSFGMKNVPYPEYAIALWAARRVGRPVRWIASRLESFQGDAHARDQWADATLALDENGMFLGFKVRVVANLGAYVGPTTPHSPTANVGGMAGVYRTPHIHVRVEGVMTNTQQTAAYRGAGRPEATYVIERMIDLAAVETGIDRVELRRRNLIAPSEMPFKTGLVFTYDSGDFPTILDMALKAADWRGFERRQSEARSRGRLRGIGIANPIEIAGGPAGKPHPEFSRLVLDPDGSGRLFVGSFDTGQGHGTSYRQLLSATMGVDPARLTVVAGDTELVPKGTGSFGSRTLSAAGTAISRAADDVVKKLKDKAADLLEAAAADLDFENGHYVIAGTDRRLALSAVVAAGGKSVEAEAFVSATAATFPNGCHVCELEIDPDTGSVEVLSYIVVDDVGQVLNPLLVKGQISGGVTQGLGQALMEEARYDPDSGQLLSATFMDYTMPRAEDVPFFVVESFPVPTNSNPLGVKGVGEAGTVGALSAVMSAICDALAPLGILHLDMPATPEKVWRAIQQAKGRDQSMDPSPLHCFAGELPKL